MHDGAPPPHKQNSHFRTDRTKHQPRVRPIDLRSDSDMPKYKACDWSGTWSPESPVEDIPDFIAHYLSDDKVIKAAACIEQDEDHKAHLHFGFRLRREYDSNYSWWEKEWREYGFEKPALHINATRDLHGLIGGYFSKAEGTRIVFRKNFTDGEIQTGRDLYKRGLERRRVKKFLDTGIIIHPAKLDAAIAAAQEESGDDPFTWLDQHGFHYGNSTHPEVTQRRGERIGNLAAAYQQHVRLNPDVQNLNA